MEKYTTQAQSATKISSLFKSLYMQMAAALIVTGLTAYFLSQSAAFITYIFANPSIIWISLLVELGVVFALSSQVTRMSMSIATLLFILYSVLNGITFSTVFIAYDLGSIATTFFVTAGTFFAMSLIGMFTNMDLSKIGNTLYMMLIGLLIATIVNIFLSSTTLHWIITYAGVIIFVGLIAWDTQKLKQLFYEYGTNDDNGQKLALLGALTLYLDFINLFLFLLRILGNSRD